MAGNAFSIPQSHKKPNELFKFRELERNAVNLIIKSSLYNFLYTYSDARMLSTVIRFSTIFMPK
jgi:hypothetical protein